jgi:hypothetical protein
MTITVTISGESLNDVLTQMNIVLSSTASGLMAATAGAKAGNGQVAAPKAARGRPKTALKVVEKPEPEEDADEGDEEGEGEEAAGGREEVIQQLTEIFQGGDKDTRDKIKAWRDKKGLKLLRDLSDEHIPAAMKLIEDLSA